MDAVLLRRLGPVIERGENGAPAGSFELYTPTPLIVVTIARGHLALPFSEAIARVRATLLRGTERVTVFHDWEEAATYDHDFRANNQRTASEVADRLHAIHVLARRGMIAMGVSTVGLALSQKGSTHVTTVYERAPFESQLREALGR